MSLDLLASAFAAVLSQFSLTQVPFHIASRLSSNSRDLRLSLKSSYAEFHNSLLICINSNTDITDRTGFQSINKHVKERLNT